MAAPPVAQQPVAPPALDPAPNPTEPAAPLAAPPNLYSDRKVTSKPLQTHAQVVKSTGISLKNLYDQKEQVDEGQTEEVVKRVETKENLARDPYTSEAFTTVWNNFCAVVKREDNLSTYATLSVKVPKVLEGDVIDLVLSGEYQLKGVQVIREQLLTYIRKGLNNHQITVQTRIVKNESSQEKFYTDKDKFNALVKQNPELEKLRKALGLDVEF